MNRSWRITGGTVVDPISGRTEIKDIYVKEGVITDAESPASPQATPIDATGLTVVPGLIDLHVHFREPGQTEAEDIESGSRAAAKGGFTTVVTMPNTIPPVDSARLITKSISKADAAGFVRLKPAGCITRHRKGKHIAGLSEMAAAGAAAFTDDGATVRDTSIMKAAMEECHRLCIPILDHALDPEIAGQGVMHEGFMSENLSMPGIPSEAETSIVQRDISLAAQTGCRIHLQHLSALGSVDLLKKARSQGIPVTGEATPHHLCLTDRDIDAGNPNYKMNPPLREEKDRLRLVQGLAENVITILATDHAPHSAVPGHDSFLDAPFGVTGLETAVGITYSVLVKNGPLSLADWVRKWTTGPAAVLGIKCPGLLRGDPADLTILDLNTEYTIDHSTFFSKSANTPFAGRKVTGQSLLTMMNGNVTWKDKSLC
ncbi:MAG: dihydroorotase [Verrucomicrobiota bacterium]